MSLHLTKRNYLFIGSLFMVLQAFIVAQLPVSQLMFDVCRNLAITGAIAMIITFLYALIMAANREASFKEAFFYLGVLVILILVLMYIYVKKWHGSGKPPIAQVTIRLIPQDRAGDYYPTRLLSLSNGHMIKQYYPLNLNPIIVETPE